MGVGNDSGLTAFFTGNRVKEKFWMGKAGYGIGGYHEKK